MRADARRIRGEVGVSVAIVGAAAVSPRGFGWRGLGERGESHPATLLAGVVGYEVPPIPDAIDAGDAKSRRLMARAARFAAIAARDAVGEAGWSSCADVGYWLGVGASAGPLGELVAILRASVEDGKLSLARLGTAGLVAANPLHTFHVLNNFTMCHGAIAVGTTGPNSALFSRGAGTVHALAEAVHAIESNEIDRALAGGADTAIHPTTWCELVRDGFGELVPSEGAGVLALARDGERPALAPAIAIVEHVAVGDHAAAAHADLYVIAPWGEAVRGQLRELAGGADVIDATAWYGEALAAAPALAWLCALDRIANRRATRVAILSCGIDGELGVVVLRAVA